MSYFVRRRWPLALITLAALWLRTHDLARRPMHADEANQAVKAGELLETGRYAFDPHDHHGPTLYYALLPIAWLRGERSLAELSEQTVRLVPVIFGTASVVLLAILAAGLTGRATSSPARHEPTPDQESRTLSWPALAAAAFMAVSPPAVYYSRYFVQETLLVTFTLGTFVATQRWWTNGGLRWAVAAGICAGLMQATKATAPLFLFAALAAVLLASIRHAAARPLQHMQREHRLKHVGLHLIAASAAAVLVAALLYSSFGTHPGGIRDAFSTYSAALTRFGADSVPTGHEKPWWYYLRLFGWYREGGLVWHQLAFSGLAIAGIGVSITRASRRSSPQSTAISSDLGRNPPVALSRRFLVWAALYTVFVITAFSLFSYKTPWQALHFVPGLALLAAAALAALTTLQTGKYVALGFALFTLATLYQQTGRVAFLRPADARNPYAYVHSSADVLKFRALAESALARSPGQPIRVISEEYWPLPWYLRGLPNVGYWPSVPEECDGALVITSLAAAESVRACLRGEYRESFLGLRPGFFCILFTAESGNEETRE